MFRPSRNLLFSLHRVKKCCVVYFNQDLSEVENECKNTILCNYVYIYYVYYICVNILIIFFINSNALIFYFYLLFQLFCQMNIKKDLQKASHFIWMLKQLHL